ncbi:hypothetical protein CVIRNUC_000340 [Coccomyxa viridis]|uniref:Uroporphyrinogen-III synthase n=1 Tax=Coccomyxa viridis TaxID=1274662 RepID=A0AAV1HRG7_9CHLO|nr:hypothetical protein CVIRNUC_000340 [Coccomyxa viridis]
MLACASMCSRCSCTPCAAEVSTSYSGLLSALHAARGSRCQITGSRVPFCHHLPSIRRARSIHAPCRGIRAASEGSLDQQQKPEVVLTRERGKNGHLMKALQQQGVRVLEMPLVETIPGPDRDQLPAVLQEGAFDWIIITSPEAAAVFLKGWEAAGQPEVNLAVVGAGTGKVFEEARHAPSVAFSPSKANAEHLSAELPLERGRSVLYPASAKAGSTLQEGLQHRDFAVRRLNTYNTVPVESLAEADVAAAREASVAAFASPSALKSWLALVGGQDIADVAIACIGSTTAQAAERLGFEKVYFPDAPGVEGFVHAIVEALQQNNRSKVLSAI